MLLEAPAVWWTKRYNVLETGLVCTIDLFNRIMHNVSIISYFEYDIFFALKDNGVIV